MEVIMQEKSEVLKVAATSSPSAVAGALANTIRENHGRAELQAIGAGSVNVAVKAIIIARGFLAPAGYELVCMPAFCDVTINGEDKTAIKILVKGL